MPTTSPHPTPVPERSTVARVLLTAFGALALLTVLTGVVYPLVVTSIAKVAFGPQARGNLIEDERGPSGSRLIGQSFEQPKYFWGRLSATTPMPYNGAGSTGSNLGPTNDVVRRAAEARIDALRAADPGNLAPVPVDLVTASGSGLDPHITPAAAEYQLGRVARARGMPVTRVRQLVEASTEHRAFGVFGEPRVNVLVLNRRLDQGP